MVTEIHTCVFFPKSFIFLDFKIGSLIHFGLTYVDDVRQESTCILWSLIFRRLCVSHWNDCSSPFNWIWSYINNILYLKTAWSRVRVRFHWGTKRIPGFPTDVYM